MSEQIQNAEWEEVRDISTPTAIRIRPMTAIEARAQRKPNKESDTPHTFPLAPLRTQFAGSRDLTTVAFAQEAYRINPLIFSLINRRAGAVQQAALCAYDLAKPEEEQEPIVDTPVIQLLRNPNPLFDGKRFIAIQEIYKDIGGTVFNHVIRDGTGQIYQIYAYHGSQIRAIQGEYDWVIGYRYANGTGFVCDLPIADVCPIHWPSINVNRPYEVVPPLVALAQEIDIDNERARMAISLLLNGSIPAFTITAPDGTVLTQQMIDTQAERVMERLGGKQRGRPMILPHGTELNAYGFSPDEMATDAFATLPQTLACEVFGVPIQITALPPGLRASQFKNYQEAEKTFYERTMTANWQSIGEAYTDYFKDEPFFGETRQLRIGFDTSRVPAMQDSLDQKQDRSIKLWSGGVTQLNEARAVNGLPPDEKNGTKYFWEVSGKASAPPTDTKPESETLTRDDMREIAEETAGRLLEAAKRTDRIKVRNNNRKTVHAVA